MPKDFLVGPLSHCILPIAAREAAKAHGREVGPPPERAIRGYPEAPPRCLYSIQVGKTDVFEPCPGPVVKETDIGPMCAEHLASYRENLEREAERGKEELARIEAKLARCS